VVSWNQNGPGNPAQEAVLWIMGPASNGFQMLSNNRGASPVVITAYAALPTKTHTLAQLNWTDYQNGPGAVQFAEPTVVDGHVYAAGESISNNSYHGVQGLCNTVDGCSGAVTVWY
jgi:hypothetical protein